MSALLNTLERYGYGVYRIDGGKLESTARYAVADPYDDADGFYLEGKDLAHLAQQAIDAVVMV